MITRIFQYIILVFVFNYAYAESDQQFTIQYSKQVKQLLNHIKPNLMWKNLESLTNFPDRSPSHESGVKAGLWIEEQIEKIIKKCPRSDVSLYTVETKGIYHQDKEYDFKQPSIILQIGDEDETGIVLGAHYDTYPCATEGCLNDPKGPFPGANDNATGVVTLLEVARILLTTQLHFKHPIYIIWHAAEEDDLAGSKAVVAEFKEEETEILAMMQLDMTGYRKENDNTIWFTAPGKYVNKELTDYAIQLTKKYVKKPVNITKTDDESDHWSWANAGYKTVFPRDSDCPTLESCPRIEHTNEDTLDKISLRHMTDYLKLAIAFTVELAQPDSQMVKCK